MYQQQIVSGLDSTNCMLWETILKEIMLVNHLMQNTMDTVKYQFFWVKTHSHSYVTSTTMRMHGTIYTSPMVVSWLHYGMT